MSNVSLSRTINSLDQQITTDTSLDRELFDALLAQQRELGLLHGDRPTCPFLRPHILSRSHYQTVTRAAGIIATAFEALVERALIDDALMNELGLTPIEAKMARIDPGYSRLCVTSRLDAYLTQTGFQFLEYNAESPAGVGDQMQLEKLLFDLPHMRDFLAAHEHWRPEPHRRLLESLLAAYRDWGGEAERPQIGIIDWEGVATASEFTILKQYFDSEGVPSIIADPRTLEFNGEVLKADDFRIDILYKRVIIHEFLEKSDIDHPLRRAYEQRKVCMANSFRSKVAHKKSGFAILSDPEYASLFTTEQLEAIGSHIPWTRRVQRGPALFEGVERELPELMRSEQARLVLKPNDDYGGHGIVLGWEVSAAEWELAIANAMTHPYVVQQRVPAGKVNISTYSDRAETVAMNIDFNPFLFHNEAEGALVRLSATSLSNVTAGGGQTALLVLEEPMSDKL